MEIPQIQDSDPPDDSISHLGVVSVARGDDTVEFVRRNRCNQLSNPQSVSSYL